MKNAKKATKYLYFGDEKDSKATEKDSVEDLQKKAEDSGFEISSASIPANKDSVSDDSLKAAFKEDPSTPKASDKEEDKATKKEEKIDEEKKEEEEDDSSLDEGILAEISKDQEKEKEKLSDKQDRPEMNKVKELERKLEELTQKTQNIPAVPGVKEYSDEWFEKVGEKYGVDAAQAKAFITMSEDAVGQKFTAFQEEIDKLKSKDVLSETKKDLEKDKLYSVLKDEVKRVMVEDPDIKDLPDSPAKYRLALKTAKADNIEKVIKAAKKKARKQSEDSRRIIPSDDGTVSKEIVKEGTIKLTQEDLKIAKELGYTQKELKDIGKTPVSFVEE